MELLRHMEAQPDAKSQPSCKPLGNNPRMTTSRILPPAAPAAPEQPTWMLQ